MKTTYGDREGMIHKETKAKNLRPPQTKSSLNRVSLNARSNSSEPRSALKDRFQSSERQDRTSRSLMKDPPHPHICGSQRHVLH